MSINGIKLSESARRAIETLNENGYRAFVVGGAVRDLLSGKTPSDYDVATSALPEEVIKVFDGEKVIKTGLKHGTVTVLLPEPIEITTFRIDGDYEDKRRPSEVRFVREIDGDLKRRDFTVNALAYSQKDGIIDLYGGIEDLKRGIIRAVGEPYKRFEEDALRILRALRFSATEGFKIEKKTSEALIALKDNLKAVSKERVFSELSKIISGKFATEVLLTYAEVFFVVIPELEPCYKFDQRSKWHLYDVYEHIARAVGSVENDETLRWTMLFHDVKKPEKFFIGKDGEGHFYGHAEASANASKEILKRLKAPNKLINAVFLRILYHDAPIKNDVVYIKRKLNSYGEELFFDLLKIKRADNEAQGTALALKESEGLKALKETAESIIENGEPYRVSDLEVSGKDLEDLGFSGERIGETLNSLLSAVIAGDLENDREKLIKSAKKRLKK